MLVGVSPFGRGPGDFDQHSDYLPLGPGEFFTKDTFREFTRKNLRYNGNIMGILLSGTIMGTSLE